MPTLSIVIPVYNSLGTFPELVSRLSEILPAISDQYEVILINDGSRDQSWKVISQLASQYPWLKGINLMRNYGQHNALLCGIRAAQYEIIVTMDDDLQHPPEELPVLLAEFNQGYDVVYGTPIQRQHGLWRNLASFITKIALQGAMGAQVARNTSAWRVFRTQIREAFGQYQGPYVSIDVLLTWGTNNFRALPVRHEPRTIGASNYNFRKLLRLAITMLTGFSTLPLQIASMAGFASTLFGLAVLVYVISRYFIEGGSVPGFPFLASIITIFSGVQLFALGIIGEYLARMHFRLMDRPPYMIRESTNHS